MITASKLVIGTIALAGVAAVGLTARRAFLGGGITLPPIVGRAIRPEDVARARARYANRSPLDVREIFVDLSGSYRREPSACARPSKCHGMLETAIAGCDADIADLRSADVPPPGGSFVLVASLGAGSFRSGAYVRSVHITYPLMPAPPSGWDQPADTASDDAALAAVHEWRTSWRAWLADVERRAAQYRSQLESICTALGDQSAEETTDVLSTIELLIRSMPSGDAHVRVRGYSDLEEALGGRRKPHTARELAEWCASIGLTFPLHTTVDLFVTTSAPTLKLIDDRWRPLFLNCGMPTEAIRFIPLARRPPDVATP